MTKPIHKFNNGNGATICSLCTAIITVGEPTNDLYCDKCLNRIVKLEKEFSEQMNKEVHQNKNNLNK